MNGKAAYTFHQHFEFDFCFEEAGGGDVIAFDINHWWNLPECRPGVLSNLDHLIKVESSLYRGGLDDDDISMIGFPVRFRRAGKGLQLGRGRRAYRFPVRNSWAGGNMYWETFLFPAAVARWRN